MMHLVMHSLVPHALEFISAAAAAYPVIVSPPHLKHHMGRTYLLVRWCIPIAQEHILDSMNK